MAVADKKRAIPLREIKTFTSLRESKPSVKGPGGRRVYKDVTLIRAGLGNERDKNYYPAAVLESAVNEGLFEGLRAFVDHPNSIEEEAQPERTIRDFAGLYKNARFDLKEKAVKADLEVLRSQKWLTDTIDDLMEMGYSDKMGLSINGRGQTEPKRIHLEEAGGEVDVNELQKFVNLRSTDIVTEAGAGGGFPALLESARKAAGQSSPTMQEITSMSTRAQLLTALREAAGDPAKVKKIATQLEQIDATDSKKRPRRATEAEEPEDDDAEAVAEAEEPDEDVEDDPDHDQELEDAVEEVKEEDADPGDEDDEDDDVEESDDDEDDEDKGDDEAEEPRRPQESRSAAQRQRDHVARAREAGITGATGHPTGKVSGGVGSFTKKRRAPSKKSRPPKVAQRARFGSTKAVETDAKLQRQLDRLTRENDGLRRSLTTRMSADRARKLLQESDIPASVRPHLVRDLIGLNETEMRREIARQERLLEAVAEATRESMVSGYDDIEGVGAPLRETRWGGSRRDASDASELLESVGLPVKKRKD